jgi:CheY-like chemotaxis protein
MRWPRFTLLLGVALASVAVAAPFNVQVRQVRTLEDGIVTGAYIQANGDTYAVVVPHGWKARASSSDHGLSLNSQAGDTTISILFSDQDVTALMDHPDRLRQAVVPYLAEARVVEEFPAYSGLVPGRGLGLSYVRNETEMKTRVAVVPLENGNVSFHHTGVAKDQGPPLQMLGPVLGSFRRATLPGPEASLSVPPPSAGDSSPRAVAELGGDAVQIVAALHTVPPAPEAIKPARRSFLDGKKDYLRLGGAVLLLGLLAIHTLGRHYREAEIRALCGGYLSDGTEVAKFKMPEWFAPPAAVPPPAAEMSELGEVQVAEVVEPGKDLLQEFLAQAPAQIAGIRQALRELGRSGTEAEWRRALGQLPQHITSLREKADFWEMRPAWQLSSAMELLANRIVAKPKDATPSTLRTITAATDLLQVLCAPGVRPNLIIEPPLKILAVDDDALCLRAVEFALQKAGLASEAASNGVQALAMASNKTFDVIFMDIQMPEMDGLTACTRIRETPANAETPVVFVTIQSDFHTRAQSTLNGGSDLIAKPFLVFELTVKALMAAMRKRLQTQNAVNTVRKPLAPAPAAIRAAIKAGVEVARSAAAPASAVGEVHETVEELVPIAGPGQEFSDRSADALLALQKILEEVPLAPDAAGRQETLGLLYLQVHAFATQAQLAGLQIGALVGSNLEALIKKLYEKPERATVSSLNTVASALQLLGEVCRADVDQKLADPSRVRMLVVDDEPLALRAIAGALQLAFDKPESAADGAAALELVRQNAYDVIFTDVQMPGLDGFQLCHEIRRTELNRNTPVVFVTGQNDSAAREQAALSGGSDFIAKPCLPVEVALKALTFMVRKRLELPAPSMSVVATVAAAPPVAVPAEGVGLAAA